jgi:hypothetical protein
LWDVADANRFIEVAEYADTEAYTRDQARVEPDPVMGEFCAGGVRSWPTHRRYTPTRWTHRTSDRQGSPVVVRVFSGEKESLVARGREWHAG